MGTDVFPLFRRIYQSNISVIFAMILSVGFDLNTKNKNYVLFSIASPEGRLELIQGVDIVKFMALYSFRGSYYAAEDTYWFLEFI